MLFSWLFSNTGRLLQTYNFTLEFQFYYCCCLFIIVFFYIYLLSLVASLRTKPQSSGYYPGAQNSELNGKFGGRTGLKCQILLAKRQDFCLNLYTDLRQIKQIRTDSKPILISPTMYQPKTRLRLYTYNMPHAVSIFLLHACVLIIVIYISKQKLEVSKLGAWSFSIQVLPHCCRWSNACCALRPWPRVRGDHSVPSSCWSARAKQWLAAWEKTALDKQWPQVIPWLLVPLLW